MSLLLINLLLSLHVLQVTILLLNTGLRPFNIDLSLYKSFLHSLKSINPNR